MCRCRYSTGVWPGCPKRPLMRAMRSSISSRCCRYSGLSSRDGTSTWSIVVVRARLGSPLEQALEREQLLRDALRVVEPLDAEDELASRVLLLELREQARGLRVRERLAEPGGVDADRVDADARPAAADLDRVRLRVEPEDAQARRAEVARVVADVEADVVGAEQAAQHLLARREEPVHLGRGERRVQEEADREIGRPAPQHRGHEHEVEVVHPDARVRPASARGSRPRSARSRGRSAARPPA